MTTRAFPGLISPAASKSHWSVSWPEKTHWRRATCREVDCPHYLLGWTTTLPLERQDLMSMIRTSGLEFTEAKAGDGLIQFTFTPGQTCFRVSTHRTKAERDPLFRRGHQFGQYGPSLEHDRWMWEMNEHVHRIEVARR